MTYERIRHGVTCQLTRIVNCGSYAAGDGDVAWYLRRCQGVHEVSADAARHCLSEGALVACEEVWAETATFQASEKFRRAMVELAVTFETLSEDAAIKAAEA
jgi:hypothetical protein